MDKGEKLFLALAMLEDVLGGPLPILTMLEISDAYHYVITGAHAAPFFIVCNNDDVAKALNTKMEEIRRTKGERLERPDDGGGKSLRHGQDLRAPERKRRMKIIWEDFLNREGARTEVSLRILFGTGSSGYDEEVYKMSVSMAVYKNGEGTWCHSINLDRKGPIPGGVRSLNEAKAAVISLAAEYTARKIHAYLSNKPQEHRDGLV